jgi:hypothetical protein
MDRRTPMRFPLMVAACLLFLASPRIAIGQQTFMPPNNLHLQPNLAPTMSQAEFNQVIDKVEEYYKHLIKEVFDAELHFNRKWSDNTVNASAYQFGKSWYVNMYGGLARRVTKEGLLAVACHELGHHLGGYPFYSRSGWGAAVEGQSDYFAAQSCMKNILLGERKENKKAAEVIPEYPKAQCDASFETEERRNLCYRIMLGVKSTADLLAFGRVVKYESKDESKVFSTDERHPKAQCRLDTFVAAAVCTRHFNETVIPGKHLGKEKNSEEAEKLAALESCHALNGDLVGLRPRCWFAPKIK